MAAATALTVVVWQLGFGPFLDGVRAVDGAALGAGAAIGALTTVCCAWRWTVVARGLGLRLPFPAAVAACYRSVFLNLTLPGGVVGDVHRGVSHGRHTRDITYCFEAIFSGLRLAGSVRARVGRGRCCCGAAWRRRVVGRDNGHGCTPSRESETNSIQPLDAMEGRRRALS